MVECGKAAKAPEEYVRRSVANNLNDISKDHPDLVVEVAGRWWTDADDNRRRLVRHALRTLIKDGNDGALDVIGYGPGSPVQVQSVSVEPAMAPIGSSVPEIPAGAPSARRTSSSGSSRRDTGARGRPRVANRLRT